MIDPATKIECACPMNGKLCVDGTREDFPMNGGGGKMKCRWWQHVAGKDPQRDRQVDHFDCAIAWLPVTTLEAAQMSRQTSASVDKVATSVDGVKSNITNLVDAIEIVGFQIRKGIETGGVALIAPARGKDGE